MSCISFRPRPRSATGFSLVELLGVIALMALLMAMAGLGKHLISSASRRSAALALMQDWLEQARATAIERGEPVYLALPDRSPLIPASHARRQSALFRLHLEEPATPATPPTPCMVPLGEWNSLPKGLVLSAGTAAEPTVFDLDGARFDLPVPGLPEGWRPLFRLPGLADPVAMPYLAFDRLGALAGPDIPALFVRLREESPEPGQANTVERLRVYPVTGRVSALMPHTGAQEEAL